MCSEYVNLSMALGNAEDCIEESGKNFRKPYFLTFLIFVATACSRFTEAVKQYIATQDITL